MRLKRGLLAGIALCCMPLMTACSAKDTIGILVGNNSEDTKRGSYCRSECSKY